VNQVIGTDGSAIVTCPQMHPHGTVPLNVAYDSDEPLTIALVVTDAANTTYAWQLARDLLLQAAVDGDRNDCAVVGLGDVTLKVRSSNPREITLRLPVQVVPGVAYEIVVRNEKKFIYLIVDREQLRSFVLDTYRVVPAHLEVDHLPLDDVDRLVEEWKK
jgi:hypothetical protein